jgi:hypothetical protein
MVIASDGGGGCISSSISGSRGRQSSGGSRGKRRRYQQGRKLVSVYRLSLSSLFKWRLARVKRELELGQLKWV